MYAPMQCTLFFVGSTLLSNNCPYYRPMLVPQNIGSGVICGITYRASGAVDAFGFIFYVSFHSQSHITTVR